MISKQSKMSDIFELDDNKLIEKFSQGSDRLLASQNLRLEVNGKLSQLIAGNGESIAIMYLQNKPRNVIVKNNCAFTQLIDSSLIDLNFVLMGDASRAGFSEYRHYETPAGYRVWYTDPSILWKKWWPTERFHDKQRFNMDILVNIKDNWYPVQGIEVNSRTFTIKTIAGQLVLKRDRDKVLWLAQVMLDGAAMAPVMEAEVAANAGHSRQPEFTSQVQNSQTSANLAAKIQQKQSEINSAQAWTMIKELEQKLQAQIKLAAEAQEQSTRSEHRAMIAEQRLKVVYRHLEKIGVNPQDIYSAN